MPHSRSKVVADGGVQLPNITGAAALGTDGSGNVVASNSLLWRVDINPWGGPPDTATAGWTRAATATELGWGNITSVSTQPNEFDWFVGLIPGTWELTIIYAKGPNIGIFVPTLDGNVQSSQDAFNSTAVFNQIYTASGITISTAGQKTLQTKVTTKNASATAFFQVIQWITLRRTA